MTTGWELGSLDLRTVGFNIANASGWDSIPGMKMAQSDNGYRHGYFRETPGRWVYQDRDVILNMQLYPVDATTGEVLTSPTEHLEENLEAIAAVMYSPTGVPLVLTKTTPSGVVKTINVYPINLATVQEEGKFVRGVTLVLNAPYPFWHVGAIDNNPGLSGSFSLTNDGNAPINDMVITFNAAVTLTHTASGAQLVTTTGGITLDVGAGSAGLTGGDQDEISANKPWLMEMVPGSNAFTASGGTVAINYYHASLT